MSRAHSTVPVAEASDLEAALAVLRVQGLRVSASRRLILESLYRAGEPVTADRIASGLDGALPPSDVASVYRNLEVLEEAGLVRHVHLGHGPGLYVRAAAGVHEYLLCESCGAVRAVEPERLDGVRALIERELGFQARFTHFPIAGLCPDCTEAGHAHP